MALRVQAACGAGHAAGRDRGFANEIGVGDVSNDAELRHVLVAAPRKVGRLAIRSLRLRGGCGRSHQLADDPVLFWSWACGVCPRLERCVA